MEDLFYKNKGSMAPNMIGHTTLSSSIKVELV